VNIRRPFRSEVWRCERCGHVLGQWLQVERHGQVRLRMILNHPATELADTAAFVTCPVCGEVNIWRFRGS